MFLLVFICMHCKSTKMRYVFVSFSIFLSNVILCVWTLYFDSLIAQAEAFHLNKFPIQFFPLRSFCNGLARICITVLMHKLCNLGRKSAASNSKELRKECMMGENEIEHR